MQYKYLGLAPYSLKLEFPLKLHVHRSLKLLFYFMIMTKFATLVQIDENCNLWKRADVCSTSWAFTVLKRA